MKTVNNQVELVENQIDAKNSTEDTITFSEPLKIVGTGRKQWNGTIYDLNSTNVDTWDGLITQDHGTKLSDVIGKATKVFKNESGIFISGIKYAIKENPAAILAMNLLKGGFATGFSCETIGPDPEDGVWKNHKVCGLSQVSHPNSSECYAVVSNSIEEARKNNLETSELDAILAKLVKNDETLEKEDEEEPEEIDESEEEDNLEEATLSTAERQENENKIAQLNEVKSEYDSLIELLENEIKREEFESKLDNLDKIVNGGPGSGNHNPGQGRGVGKPSAYAKSVKQKKLTELRKKRDEIGDRLRFAEKEARRTWRKSDEEYAAKLRDELAASRAKIKETSKKDAVEVGKEVLEERKIAKAKEDREKSNSEKADNAAKSKNPSEKALEIAKSLKDGESTSGSYTDEKTGDSVRVLIGNKQVTVSTRKEGKVSEATDKSIKSSFGEYTQAYKGSRMSSTVTETYDSKTGKKTEVEGIDRVEAKTKDGTIISGEVGNGKYNRTYLTVEKGNDSGFHADLTVRIESTSEGLSTTASFYRIDTPQKVKDAKTILDSSTKFASEISKEWNM